MNRPTPPAIASVLAGLAVGLPGVAIGLLAPGRTVIPMTVPVLDVTAIISLLLAAVISVLDSRLGADRRSLPTLSLCLAGIVLWTAHLVLFPGDVPNLGYAAAGAAASAVFLSINLTMPVMLAVALIQGGDRRLGAPSRSLAISIAAGLLAGTVITLIAVLTAPEFPTVSAVGRFNSAEAFIGGASAVPAILGLVFYLSGRRGDERVSGGIAAALALLACNSLLLPFIGERYTIGWYADHILATLAPVALLSGQMVILLGALRQEQLSASALRTSLEMAEALAREVDLGSLIDRLMVGAMSAVAADRATLMTLDGDELQIEASIDRRGTPAPIGRRFPATDLQVDGVPIVPETVRSGHPLATPAYDVGLLTPDHADSVGGVRHYITWPLFLGGRADAILFLARRDDRPFGDDDVSLLHEFATIAALLLRNARLLRDAEGASVAKSSFLNLAAHELRTPLSVIRGYVDMLADGDLGDLPEGKRSALRVLHAKADDLVKIVDQLLAGSRLDGGAVPPPLLERVDLCQAGSDAIARARARTELIGAEVKMVWRGEVTASASPGFLAVILDNLLNNALTYSRPPALVQVEVGDEGGPYLRVTDSGIGIAPEQRSRVFDRFHRVDRPDFGYPGGTGLGLYLARHHAEAMGGTLELEWSEVDEGTRFILRLPADEGGSRSG